MNNLYIVETASELLYVAIVMLQDPKGSIHLGNYKINRFRNLVLPLPRVSWKSSQRSSSCQLTA